jgi:uncharacterized membrane protein
MPWRRRGPCPRPPHVGACAGPRAAPFDSTWPAVQSISLEAAYCVTSRRNDSLGSRGRWQIFAALCTVSFGLALGFAAFGAWLVLPYSALEMLVLYLAFRWIGRHAADWERVSIRGDRVLIERQRAGILTRHEFNRCWTRLEADPGEFSRAPRLTLCSAGERVPFGDDLPAPERESAAKSLRRALAVR